VSYALVVDWGKLFDSRRLGVMVCLWQVTSQSIYCTASHDRACMKHRHSGAAQQIP